MNKIAQIIGQAFFYGLFVAVTWYFSAAPAYQNIEPETSLIKISMAHVTQPAGECVKRTPEELAKLAPNMRIPIICPRERAPLYMEVELDDKMIYQETIIPAGISRDSASYSYHKINVPSGAHNLKVRMRDSLRMDGFDHVAEIDIELVTSEILVIDFDSKHGEFVFE